MSALPQSSLPVAPEREPKPIPSLQLVAPSDPVLRSAPPPAAHPTSTVPPRTSTHRRTSPAAFDVRGRHVYLIGIGGSGMSGLARMLRGRGAAVSGSDRESSQATAALADEGIAIGYDQTAASLPEACDIVIASAAVRPDHPQMLEAARRGVETMSYAEALGHCMIGRTGVAISGTHGKSTTTAMLGATLVDCGLDPTVIVGATCAQLATGSLGGARDATPSLDGAWATSGFRLGAEAIPSGTLAGRPGILVAEACEFNRSFHNYHPTVASISSVEADHLDCYGTLDAVVESFRQFAALLPPASAGGKLLIAHDNAHRREVTAGLDCEIHTIGFSPQADFMVSYDATTRRVRLTHQHSVFAEWTLTVAGAHNAFNSSVALILATWLGADARAAAASLSVFRGVDRRMQFLGEKQLPGGSVRVFDDYGHHPTEIDVTLRAFRESERPEDRGGRLICVFQPHQHSRTRHLLEEFANSFSGADMVIVPDIYFVRDSQEERHKVTSADLVDRLRHKGIRAMHLYPFEAIIEQLENLCRPNDMLVVMGAGPVWQVARGYLRS